MAGLVVADGAQAVRDIAAHAQELLSYAEKVRKMAVGPFLPLRVVLAATAGVPLDSPPSPAMGVPVTGDRYVFSIGHGNLIAFGASRWSKVTGDTKPSISANEASPSRDATRSGSNCGTPCFSASSSSVRFRSTN